MAPSSRRLEVLKLCGRGDGRMAGCFRSRALLFWARLVLSGWKSCVKGGRASPGQGWRQSIRHYPCTVTLSLLISTCTRTCAFLPKVKYLLMLFW